MAVMMSAQQRDDIFALLRELYGAEAREKFEAIRERHPDPTLEEANAIKVELHRERKRRASAALPAGHYALRGADGVEFYKVDRPTRGKWAGRTFVTRIAGDAEYPVKGERGRTVERLIAADPLAASALYGQELGVCGVCSRTLTNEESRAYGIGPQCRGKF